MSKNHKGLGHRSNRLRRAALFAQWSADGKPCVLCGEAIDFTLSGLDPKGPTEEHIVPVSLGGDLIAWENKAVSHRICNLKRGNRVTLRTGMTVVVEVGGTPSRDW